MLTESELLAIEERARLQRGACLQVGEHRWVTRCLLLVREVWRLRAEVDTSASPRVEVQRHVAGPTQH